MSSQTMDVYRWDEVNQTRIAPAATQDAYCTSITTHGDDSDMDWAPTDVYAEYERVSACRSTIGWPEYLDGDERYQQDFEARKQEPLVGSAPVHAYIVPHSDFATPFMQSAAFRSLAAVAAAELAAIEAAEACTHAESKEHLRRSTRSRTNSLRASTSSSPSSSTSLTEDSIDLSTSSKATSSSTPTERTKKTARTQNERIAGFRKDEWVGLFDAKRVLCRGCGHTIKLDKRSDYYDGLWIKHCGRCAKVQEGCRIPDSRLVWADEKDSKGN
ncbi:hypothetical protein FB45DRAFT_1066377 [Roridomyces roridus]|uniref:Uncharacterized protein n=1 Tax=Roridomyces roridus TaxID=1738132 RepID=A0AAD7B4F5_9AGAR|nr:hypothetical protein FB45DRAFT_1066377 [Roridomyces roridus]